VIAPPWILAIDTSDAAGGLALAAGPALVEAVELNTADGFGHILFGELEALLGRYSIHALDVACFAAAAGPGSFTGLRVALSAVKGLAEAAAKPAVGVSSLQALAWYGTSAIRAPYLDARRGEVYGGLYDAQLRKLGEETVALFDAWRGDLPPEAELIPGGRSLASAVAAIAYERFAAGQALDPAALEANYVRRSDAEMNWKDS
jgi:tRNA threonylcarbamoyladenosine biosynthesis protein TsaB